VTRGFVRGESDWDKRERGKRGGAGGARFINERRRERGCLQDTPGWEGAPGCHGCGFLSLVSGKEPGGAFLSLLARPFLQTAREPHWDRYCINGRCYYCLAVCNFGADDSQGGKGGGCINQQQPAAPSSTQQHRAAPSSSNPESSSRRKHGSGQAQVSAGDSGRLKGVKGHIDKDGALLACPRRTQIPNTRVQCAKTAKPLPSQQGGPPVRRLSVRLWPSLPPSLAAPE
jgi:hypothetical protein